MKKQIAVLAGDGIGPEIIAEALRVLGAVEKKFDHQFNYCHGLIGAAAMASKKHLNEPYPAKTHSICMESDAILFGAIGDPRFDHDPAAKVRPEQGLLAMRRRLGLYANIRPVANFEALAERSPLKTERVSGVDLVVIRELTGGIYFGEPRGRSQDGNSAFDTCVYHRSEIDRIARLAFAYARKRRKHLTVVDKANVLETSRLWREHLSALHQNEYNDLTMDFMFVDNAAMQLVTNPRFFDVLLTENMFGDILSDEAGVITGSVGLLPSASIGTHTSLFEPIHGSFPQAAGKNIANPLATILSAAMMLEYAFGAVQEAALIQEACEASVVAKIVTQDISGNDRSYSTSEVGAWIADYIHYK